MTCNCGSERILRVNAKANDCFNWSLGENESHGDMPRDFGLGGGDYLRLALCLDCGQAIGDWPLDKTEFEEKYDPSE